jgi:hypothetical protein
LIFWSACLQDTDKGDRAHFDLAYFPMSERAQSTGSLTARLDRVVGRRLKYALAIVFVVLAGCGPKSDRLAVSGKVTLNSAPLDSGSIRFTSVAGQKLFSSGAVIGDGEFHIPQEKGLPPGTYQLEISAPDTNAPPVVYRGAPGEPRLPPTAPERIPPEYNTNSKHTIEVAADGDNHFVFDIVSKRVE